MAPTNTHLNSKGKARLRRAALSPTSTSPALTSTRALTSTLESTNSNATDSNTTDTQPTSAKRVNEATNHTEATTTRSQSSDEKPSEWKDLAQNCTKWRRLLRHNPTTFDTAGSSTIFATGGTTSAAVPTSANTTVVKDDTSRPGPVSQDVNKKAENPRVKLTVLPSLSTATPSSSAGQQNGVPYFTPHIQCQPAVPRRKLARDPKIHVPHLRHGAFILGPATLTREGQTIGVLGLPRVPVDVPWIHPNRRLRRHYAFKNLLDVDEAWSIMRLRIRHIKLRYARMDWAYDRRMLLGDEPEQEQEMLKKMKLVRKQWREGKKAETEKGEVVLQDGDETEEEDETETKVPPGQDDEVNEVSQDATEASPSTSPEDQTSKPTKDTTAPQQNTSLVSGQDPTPSAPKNSSDEANKANDPSKPTLDEQEVPESQASPGDEDARSVRRFKRARDEEPTEPTWSQDDDERRPTRKCRTSRTQFPVSAYIPPRGDRSLSHERQPRL
ncbi:hypothetical protein BDN72DRAFT_840355 [Pluteus cervinus]|uniref:Uncharacterized protein n=1 Tax=Pluteus cervinus TaxID=181527 RepID=A0ACD3AUY9_9AGAR|nr:hypothetical protein BDN72DRAFT_840355 [Pluteus cervinus]